MVAISVEYIGDLRCVALHDPSGAQIDTCAPKDNQGKGDRFSPTDLTAAALATCVATVLGIYARQKGWDLTGMRIEIQKEMSPTLPRRIVGLPMKVSMPIQLAPGDLAKVEEIAQTCPVKMSLHPDIAMPMAFHR